MVHLLLRSYMVHVHILLSGCRSCGSHARRGRYRVTRLHGLLGQVLSVAAAHGLGERRRHLRRRKPLRSICLTKLILMVDAALRLLLRRSRSARRIVLWQHTLRGTILRQSVLAVHCVRNVAQVSSFTLIALTCRRTASVAILLLA